MIKWTRDGAILIGDYSDYYFIGLFYTNVSFSFHLHCVRDSVVFFTSSETSLRWSHRLLAGYMQSKVRLILQSAFVLHIVKFRGFCYAFTTVLIYGEEQKSRKKFISLLCKKNSPS